MERYERALEQLKPEDREAIIARVEMGYSYEELAEALGQADTRCCTQGGAASARPAGGGDETWR